jgi:hypothetical protein
MEEAMLIFFYNGISPWIKRIGYTWIMTEEEYIAQKFLKFAYEIYGALKKDKRIVLRPPTPMHRDFQEDRDTFEIYMDTQSFIEFTSEWSFRNEIIGTRLEYLIREFCYTWIDVTSGKPGKSTQATLTMTDEDGSDDDVNNNIPDGLSTRRKYDLY